MAHTSILLLYPSANSNSSLPSHILCLTSEKLPETSTCHIGDQSLSMSTSIFSTRRLVSTVNSAELTTSLKSTRTMGRVQSAAWAYLSLNTSMASTTMITLEIFLPRMPSAKKTMFRSLSSQDFLFLVSGRPTGTRVTTCPRSTTCFKTKRT